MPIERFRPTYEYDDERLEQLKQALSEAAPEAMADGRINWETLQEILAPVLEEGEEGEDRAPEFFGLSWLGERDRGPGLGQAALHHREPAQPGAPGHGGSAAARVIGAEARALLVACGARGWLRLRLGVETLG